MLQLIRIVSELLYTNAKVKFPYNASIRSASRGCFYCPFFRKIFASPQQSPSAAITNEVIRVD